MAIFTFYFILNLPKTPLIFHIFDDNNEMEEGQMVPNANRDNEMNSNVIQL